MGSPLFVCCIHLKILCGPFYFCFKEVWDHVQITHAVMQEGVGVFKMSSDACKGGAGVKALSTHLTKKNQKIQFKGR